MERNLIGKARHLHLKGCQFKSYKEEVETLLNIDPLKKCLWNIFIKPIITKNDEDSKNS